MHYGLLGTSEQWLESGLVTVQNLHTDRWSGQNLSILILQNYIYATIILIIAIFLRMVSHRTQGWNSLGWSHTLNREARCCPTTPYRALVHHGTGLIWISLQGVSPAGFLCGSFYQHQLGSDWSLHSLYTLSSLHLEHDCYKPCLQNLTSRYKVRQFLIIQFVVGSPENGIALADAMLSLTVYVSAARNRSTVDWTSG